MTSNIATLNFGGINNSPIEFIDTSNSSFDAVNSKLDESEMVINSKTEVLRNYLTAYNPDMLFLTEYKTESFSLDNIKARFGEGLKDDSLSKYNMICGDVIDGLCNAIIVKKSYGRWFSVIKYNGNNDNEFKEPPLVIGLKSVVLICYNAGEKGILENAKYFTETNLYKYINSIDGSVIVGGNFNCCLADNSGEINSNMSLFPSLGDLTNIKYTSYKEMLPLQPLVDKTGKKDATVKDGFVFKNIKTVNDPSGVSMFSSVCDKFDIMYVPTIPTDEVLLPNKTHPFDHFLVECVVENPAYKGLFWSIFDSITYIFRW